MGILYLTCTMCGKNFPDVIGYTTCNICGGHVCERCMDKAFEKYGEEDEDGYIPKCDACEKKSHIEAKLAIADAAIAYVEVLNCNYPENIFEHHQDLNIAEGALKASVRAYKKVNCQNQE